MTSNLLRVAVPEADEQDERHLDNKLQTLMLARDLEAVANRLFSGV